MATKRTEESDELYDDDFDEEIDDYEDDETGDEDDEFLDDPIYRKVFEKAKADAEQAVVEALASEDTNSPVYKGLQKKMSVKDRQLQQQQQELQELRNALGAVYSDVTTQASKSNSSSKEFEAMKAIMEDMLEDDDSKKIFRNRMQQATKENEVEELKQQIANLSRYVQGQGQRQQVRQQVDDDEPDEIKQYKTQYQEALAELAEEAGVDPKDKRLDYGDWNESFLERTLKLNKSIKAVKSSGDDEAISRARKKVNTPSGPSERGNRNSETVGRSLLDIGSAQLAKKMRKVAFS